MKHKMYTVVLKNEKSGMYEFISSYLHSNREIAEECAKLMSKDMGENYQIKEFELCD